MPADESRREAGWLGAARAAGAYGLAGLACAVLLTGVLKLWRADPHVPLVYVGDAVLYQSLVKGTVENGWYLYNPALGMPHGHSLADFPMADGLHFLLIKLLALPFDSYVMPYNLYFLLGFPLAAWSALFALRRLGLDHLPALAAAVLFAFLPTHLLRGPAHLFLSAYYLVPLQALLALEVWRGRGPFVGWGGGRWRGTLLRSAGWALLCLAAGAAGAYYALFGVFFVLVAGLLAALRRHDRAPLVSALACASLVGVMFVVQYVPTILYVRQHGPNVHAVGRETYEAELYGLRLTQMILPLSAHRWTPLARLKADYYLPPVVPITEADTATLGAVGAAGLLVLLGFVFVRQRRGEDPVGGASLLMLAGMLLGWVGGIGPMLSLLGFTWIRGYCRISVFVGFFALFASGWLLHLLGRRCDGRAWLRWPFRFALGVLLLAGAWDQTSYTMVPPHDLLKQTFARDERFFHALEDRLPEGAMLYQMPFLTYVEHGPRCGMVPHDPLRPYLHTRRLRYSYGAIRGRDGSYWQEVVAAKPEARQMVDVLAVTGFAGILVHRAGYDDRGRAFEEGLAGLVGPPALVSEDGDWAFFDVRGYADRLRQGFTPDEWQRLRERNLLWPSGVPRERELADGGGGR
jgi:phosphoglycerol transferase